jgi:4-methylaminobutanoate oxidase (formaldehyde-forming)
MMQYSVGLYAELAEETGKDPGWHELGGLRLASSRERYEEIQRQAGWAKSFGLPIEIVSPAEAKDMFPLMSTDGVVAAAFLPHDGYLDPSQLTFALADGARSRGAEIEQRTRVRDLRLRDGRVHEVVTDRGTIRTDVVVLACGMYTPQVAALAGVTVPIIPYAHEFLVTEAFDPPLAPLPTLRDPDNLIYFRTEVGGLVMGGYERDPAPWALDGVPDGFEAELLPEDWERFDEILTNAVARVPAMETAEVRKLFNGPEAFTPDGEFILGESEVPGLWVAAGFCAHGLAGAGGIGWQMAEWITEGEPSLDLWHMDIRRFGGQYRSQRYALARATEVYSTYYDIKYPNHERVAGRPLRLSPAYARLEALGASFGEKSGWERANWFESNAGAGNEGLRPRGWAGQNWSPAIHAEAMATRERAGLFDQSSFAKIEVRGPGAVRFLQRVCANDVDRPVGSIVYTQGLNRRGGIECDFTVTRLDEARFRIVTGTAFGNHDLAWLRKHARREGSVELVDVTSAFACFCLWGPRSRDVLQPLTKTDLSNEAFRYMTASELAVGDVPCLGARVTYVGELGWELYCPSEYGARLWDLVWEAGEPHGLTACGYRAIDALRVEKGYRVWGADITPEDSPDEAGLGFAVKVDVGDFVGRSALVAARERGLERRLCCLVLADPRAVTLGSEPVRARDDVVGRVTSGGYGFAVERSIAYAYLPAVLAEVGTPVEVEVFGEWVAGEVAAEPLWDPKGERIRS